MTLPRRWIYPVLIRLALSPASAFAVSDLKLCTQEGVGQVVYSATFGWNQESMRIRIHKNRKKTWAEISSQQGDSTPERCEAICDVDAVAWETSPGAFQLTCQGIRFDPLAARAAIIWTSAPEIQFGSWLDGYRHAPLKVEYDQFTQARTTHRG
jgi:hypothetical protein